MVSLCHRIRAAMKIVDAPMLDGKVEMDETYVATNDTLRDMVANPLTSEKLTADPKLKSVT